MKTTLFVIAAAVLAFAACTKENTVSSEIVQPARLTLNFKTHTKAAIQTADESRVADIQVFVFKSNGLDAYKHATDAEVSANKVELDCTQGNRDIWVVVNAPDLSSVTSRAELMSSTSNMTADNASNKFVMVGRIENQTITASCSKTVSVDRIVSRIRLFQVRKAMENPALRNVEFKIVRVYVTNVIDNAAYDLFTPKHPASYRWLNVVGGRIATDNGFLYNSLSSAAVISDGSNYGTEYVDAGTQAPHTFYVYPNEYSSAVTGADQTKLVVEAVFGGDYYTYPIPLGEIGFNKTYDVKMLTVTRPGNPSDGDDDIEEGEDDPIVPATASFSVSVNDWQQVLTFGGKNGVIDGNIRI